MWCAAEKVMVTIAPHTSPVQQLCRADLRPKYGPSAHWAAKNAKLSETEQRYMVQVRCVLLFITISLRLARPSLILVL